MADSVFWFRIYHTILDNRKTEALTAAQLGYWVRILALASRNKPRGLIPPNKVLKKYLDGNSSSLIKNPKRLHSIINYYISVGLIDKRSDGNLWIHNFDSRQWLASANIPADIPTKVPTNCGHSLLTPDDENKGITTNLDTETCITESEEAFIGSFHSPMGGLEKLYLCMKDSIRDLRVSIINQYIINNNKQSCIQSSADNCGSLADTSSAECLPQDTGSMADKVDDSDSVHVSEAHRPPKECSPAAPQLVLLADQVQSRSEMAFEQITAAWAGSEGLISHKEFNTADREAVKRAMRLFSVQQIIIAIQRYSIWSVGAKVGKYRDAYRWTFYEFMTRHRCGLITRLSSDDREITCLPFTTDRPNRTDRSLESLLRKADALG